MYCYRRAYTDAVKQEERNRGYRHALVFSRQETQ